MTRQKAMKRQINKLNVTLQIAEEAYGLNRIIMKTACVMKTRILVERLSLNKA